MPALLFDTAVMNEMMEEAIQFCARKTRLSDRGQVLEAMRRGDCSVCEYLRYGLSKRFAAYLGSVDDTVKAVYTYEPEYATGADSAGPNGSAGINMVAWVSRKSAALSSLVATLNAALAEVYSQLACPKAGPLCYGVDVKVADDDEVERRIGYGALVKSLFVRPVEVWRR